MQDLCISQRTHPLPPLKRGVLNDSPFGRRSRGVWVSSCILCLLSCILYLVFSGLGICADIMLFESDRPLYVGSRPLGMGNSFVALADEAEAGFWNPAGLIQYQGVTVFASTKLWDRETNAFDSKCVAYCYRETGFFWGNKIVLRTEGGDTPDFNYYSLARKLNSYISIGGSVKFRRKHPSDYYQFFGYSPGYDLGILYKPDEENSVGILIQKLSKEKRLVNVITLGLAHKVLDNLLVSFDMAILLNHKGSLERHIGWEYDVTNWMVLRAGISEKSPTAGLGLMVGRFRIDYALIRESKQISSFISGQVQL